MTTAPDRVITPQRELWVDSLRVLVIAGVIVAHTATAYVVDIAGWYYDDERAASGVWSTLVTIPVLFGALFALGPLFVIAGWSAARSMARRGPGGFARSRLLRLGLPIVLFVVVIQPLTDYVGNLRSESRSLAYYLASTELSVMWFAAALLAFSLAYAAYEHLRPVAVRPRLLRPSLVVTAVLAVATSSFAVWLLWPLDQEVWFNLRLPQWPQGAVLFALGIHAAGSGWLPELGGATARRRLGWLAAGGVIGLVTLLAAKVPIGGDGMEVRADAPTLLFALLDGIVAVGFALWCLGWVQRRSPRNSALVARAGRASYATYFIHPLVLTTIMVLFAWAPLPPEVKFVLVGVVAIPACFVVGHWLTRAPGLSKLW